MLAKGEKILVVGSLNANEDDREYHRGQMKTVQIFDGEKFEHIPYFDGKGELGVSSFAWKSDQAMQWYYSSGSDLRLLDLANQQELDLKVPKLRGVHEIDILKNQLWVSNTYFNEILEYDVLNQEVKQRIKLLSSKEKFKNLDESEINPEDTVKENSYHCNQIFLSYEQELFALVHHVNGEQMVKRVAQRLLKSQGNGGVLSLQNGETKRLKLKAPHSVRKVDSNYWVFDSGHAQLNVYDKSWQLKQEVPMAGWGRGGVWVRSSNTFFAGVSKKRKRYLAFNEQNAGKNLIQGFNMNYQEAFQIEVPDVEQLNNLYLISEEQYKALKSLS